VTPGDRDPAAAPDNAAHGFVVLDEQARIRTANATFCQWVDDPAVLSGTVRITACLTPASRIYFDTHVLPQTLMTGHTDAVALDLQCGATRLPMLASARRVAGEDGAWWTSLTLLPAVERRRYEQELLAERRNAETALSDAREAQARLLVVSRTAALNVAATSLAHEVNQPLSSALLYLAGARRLCASGQVDPRIVRAIEEAANAVEAAGDVLKDVRRGTRGMQAKADVVDARAIIDKAWEIAGTEADAGRLRVRIPAALPRVSCDLEHVAYALAELVLNGLEASRGTESDIVVVEAVAGDDGTGDHGSLRIQVDDDGPGPPDDDVFMIGFTTKAGHGGLGLANVRTIIEAEGGTVGLAAGPGGGCRAFIELPGVPPEGRPR